MFLNPFPELLTFSLFAPLLLRVIVGGIFVWRAIVLARIKDVPQRRKGFYIAKGLLGILLVLGIWTQVVALLLIATTVYEIWKNHFHGERLAYHILLIAVLLSFLVTGAGLIAFDLPL